MLIELLALNAKSDVPLYRQLTSQITELIQRQIIQSGYKLPGSRSLADELGIHRQTVVAAIDQLVIEGWLETQPGKGTYVAENLSSVPQSFTQESMELPRAPEMPIPQVLQRNLHLTTQKYHLDDGLPDPRLAPTAELMRAYKSCVTTGNLYPRFTYGDTKGQLLLRQELSTYLNETRGIQVTADQIIITRGVTQAMYLCINGFLKPGDKVAVGELNWESANANFLYHGMELIKVKVDEEGLDIDHLEQLCSEHDIKMVYTTPHHQYPTTVIMPASRRLKLIQLARTHQFYVFEDDYDYDFFYSAHPVMPLASADHGDFVLYAGSFTKAISPVFRVGYLVANANQIDYLSRIRRMIDRQGDAILELAIAELLKLGIIQRHLKKSRRIYQERRDVFTHLLQDELTNYMKFDVPKGGMSVWTQFNHDIDLKKLYERALKRNLFITSGEQIQGKSINATRLGYASSTEEELEISVGILKDLIHQ
ncbi:MocR-like pyridoxine biosynthesis transcription factor PdxR [Marinoscillum pacificum]|uniref:MocR-like pyridoxine biosynthesis transcription factor PdxR n=1 Tax=Marinoscillum pacificum TaxID=392723 RepID=UPI0021584860|nr:PLP-dependent aminotransferase family protein [Marinoscillum pacificum]